MFYNWVYNGLKRGIVSTAYPYRDEGVAHYCGRPEIGPGACPEGCTECQQVCLAGAIRSQASSIVIDTGRCFFCGRCQTACPHGLIAFSDCFEMAAASRQSLITGPRTPGRAMVDRPERAVVSRSLYIRHVDAGSCGACVRETAGLGNPFYDASRLGIFLTTSPRHADVLLVTGPVTKNMTEPLREAHEAMPGPKFVVAAGGCAVAGGPFGQHQTMGGVEAVLPVDVYIPGCPPHPLSILDGLRLVGGRAGCRKEGK